MADAAKGAVHGDRSCTAKNPGVGVEAHMSSGQCNCFVYGLGVLFGGVLMKKAPLMLGSMLGPLRFRNFGRFL